jgi:hypothetical protein
MFVIYYPELLVCRGFRSFGRFVWAYRLHWTKTGFVRYFGRLLNASNIAKMYSATCTQVYGVYGYIRRYSNKQIIKITRETEKRVKKNLVT